MNTSKEGKAEGKRISFFGHFGGGNFGNESTLLAIIYNTRRYLPEARLTCICTDPERASAIHGIEAIPITRIAVRPWRTRNPLARLARKVLIGVPSELRRWLEALRTLRGQEMLVIPGTGLLTDAFGLRGWGPYNVFRWSLAAKLCRCKLIFVSVGAGPLDGALGRWLVKSALQLADFRSYRDDSTARYLKDSGFKVDDDPVYPDLAFSLPETQMPRGDYQMTRRRVVGLGLMNYPGRFIDGEAAHLTYLDSMAVFAEWALAHDYDVRLLIGDVVDNPATQQFKELLKKRLSTNVEGRVFDEPILSVGHLLSQLAATDVVVATRFHNVLLAMVLNKPVISISFHHKCVSLMNMMGLSQYQQDINRVDAGRLIEQFRDAEKNAGMLKGLMNQKTAEFRAALDEQYRSVFSRVARCR